jgi:hypothetical protein
VVARKSDVESGVIFAGEDKSGVLEVDIWSVVPSVVDKAWYNPANRNEFEVYIIKLKRQ